MFLEMAQKVSVLLVADGTALLALPAELWLGHFEEVVSGGHHTFDVVDRRVVGAGVVELATRAECRVVDYVFYFGLSSFLGLVFLSFQPPPFDITGLFLGHYYYYFLPLLVRLFFALCPKTQRNRNSSKFFSKTREICSKTQRSKFSENVPVKVNL